MNQLWRNYDKYSPYNFFSDNALVRHIIKEAFPLGRTAGMKAWMG